MLNVTEAQAEKAIGVLKRAIEAAENSNQAGENAVVALAAGLDLLDVLGTVRDYVGDVAKGRASVLAQPNIVQMAQDDLQAIDAAIAKATGAQ